MTSRQLLRLYPADWRERYGEEFLQLAGDEPLGLQEVIDIVSGAVDARLTFGAARGARREGRPRTAGGEVMLRALKSGCHVDAMRMTRRDGLIAAAAMIGTSLLGVALGTWLKRKGLDEASETVLAMTFSVSLAVSLPFTFMKGQPWRAQAVIVGGTLVILGAIGLVTILL